MRKKNLPARLIFAGNLRNLRLSLRWSQQELAEKSGLHLTYIGQLERGERNTTVNNMDRLASACGRDLYELLIAGKFAADPAAKRIYTRRRKA